MRFPARVLLLAAPLVCALCAVFVSTSSASFGIAKFEAGTCTISTCTGAEPATFYTQAAGHPPFGVTDFIFHTTGLPGAEAPDGSVKNIRVDLPPGVSINPTAVPQCPVAKLEESACPAEDQVGVDEISGFAGVDLPPIPVPVYNMVPPEGHPLMAGFTVPVVGGQVYIVGGLSWNTDYHEFFTISNAPTVPGLIRSRLIFNGRAATAGATPYITNPNVCNGPQTTNLFVESYEGQTDTAHYTTPVGLSGCGAVPFAPTLAVNPETTQSDQPDGATVEVKVPQDPNPEHINSATIDTAVVALPEGMTLNPSAAHGLESCAATQIGIGTTNAVSCPEASKIGTVKIETPTLPAGSLRGGVYLGNPAGGPITGPPYTIYLDAESARYGVSIRLKGVAVPNETTGQLTATFAENPQLPFSDLIVSFNGGPLAPLANPLTCGTATTTSSLTPFTGQSAVSPASAFTVDGDGHGGACPAPLPFSLSASNQLQPATAGSPSSYTLNLARADGQQYLAKVSATLPPGLVGLIPTVPLCGEPQAAQGTCPFASQIGTATVAVGSGSTPIQFSGPVALTGPYNGAPYGMSVAVQASAGPFNFGTVVVRAGIKIDPLTARVNVSASLPTIVKGVPLRLKNLSVAISRQGFLVNPTNCGALSTEAVLGSTLGASESLSTPFAVSGCGSLPFKPAFSASSNAKTSNKNGASLGIKVGYPSGAQANIKSVLVTLPKQLPARLTTLQKACPEATFNANPFACPSGSRVGGATVATPVLPEKLTGPAFFVSHGGAAFPDLDLVLNGDGVEIVLVGNTNITGSITTSNFAAIPDVPISSFELNLPIGPSSALSAVGNLCAQTLTMPTTITAQSGTVLKQNTKIAVSGCAVRVTSHKTSNHMAILKVQAPAAGRVSGSASNLKTSYVHTSKTQTITLRVPLTSSGVRALGRSHHNLKVKVRVGFVPKAKGPTSTTHVTVTFRG